MVEKAKFDEKGYLTPREHLVGIVVPESIVQEYYDSLMVGGILYVCVILRDGNPSLFFEAETEGSEAINRVFWRKDDVERYIKYVRMIKDSQDGSTVNMWEVSIDNLVKSLKKVCASTGKDKIYKSIASTYLSGILEDVDLFWTPNEEIRL
jgi:hypothetical protein